MSDQPVPLAEPPRTGHAAVDAALALAPVAADARPADELAQLSAAHEALHQALAQGAGEPGAR